MNVDESTGLYRVCPEEVEIPFGDFKSALWGRPQRLNRRLSRCALGDIDWGIERLRSRRNGLRDEILRLPREDRTRCGKRVELIAVMRELNDLRARRYSIVNQMSRDAE